MTYIREKVSPINTPDNIHISDIIGNKEDTSRISLSESSLMSHNKALYYHTHAPAGIYPSMDGPIAVSAGAGAWELGAKTAVIGYKETVLDNAAITRYGSNGVGIIGFERELVTGAEAIADGNYNLTIEIDGVEYADLATGAMTGNTVADALTGLQSALRSASLGMQTIEVLDGVILVVSTDSDGPSSTVVITEGSTNGFIAALEAAIGDTAIIDSEDGEWIGVGFPITAHNFLEGEYITILGTITDLSTGLPLYDGTYLIDWVDTDFVYVSDLEYKATTFGGTESIKESLGKAFDIHFVKISNISANGYYELIIYAGEVGEEVEIGRIGFWRGSPQLRQDDNPIQVPPQNYGTRISVALASGPGASETCDVKLYYHEYLDSGI